MSPQGGIKLVLVKDERSRAHSHLTQLTSKTYIVFIRVCASIDVFHPQIQIELIFRDVWCVCEEKATTHHVVDFEEHTAHFGSQIESRGGDEQRLEDLYTVLTRKNVRHKGMQVHCVTTVFSETTLGVS